MSHISASAAAAHTRDAPERPRGGRKATAHRDRRAPARAGSTPTICRSLGLVAIVLTGASFALMALRAVRSLRCAGRRLRRTGSATASTGPWLASAVISGRATATTSITSSTSSARRRCMARAGLLDDSSIRCWRCALLCVYLLVCAESYLGTHAAGVFRMSFLGFGPTELRMVLIAGALKVAVTPIVTVPLVGAGRALRCRWRHRARRADGRVSGVGHSHDDGAVRGRAAAGARARS